MKQLVSTVSHDGCTFLDNWLDTVVINCHSHHTCSGSWLLFIVIAALGLAGHASPHLAFAL